MAEVLAPAVELASVGFPVSPLTAHSWAAGERVLMAHLSSGCAPRELLVNAAPEVVQPARAPLAGEIFRNPAMAAVLREVGAKGAAGFYEGWVAESIVAAVAGAGGALSAGDLRAHVSEAVTPLSVTYGSLRVWELPPNGQGLAALLALNNLSALAAAAPPAGAGERCGGGACCCGLGGMAAAGRCAGEAAPPPRGACCALPPGASASPPRPPACSLAGHTTWGSPAHLHAMVESMRLAFADARWHCADPAQHAPPLAELLSPAYAATRVGALQPLAAAADVLRGAPVAGSDTVSFSVVDSEGNAASFINSNYMGFGSGIVPRGCGFSLQNRGAGFSLSATHPNVLAPGKRPYHTIIPGMATWAEDGALFAAFSNMGGFMQPQGHMQVRGAPRCGRWLAYVLPPPQPPPFLPQSARL